MTKNDDIMRSLRDDVEAHIRSDLQCWIQDAFKSCMNAGLSQEVAREIIYFAFLSSFSGGLLVDQSDARHASQLLRNIIESGAKPSNLQP
jgi:hypothetical protein